MNILVGRPDFSFVYANVVLYSVAQVAAELVAARQKIHSIDQIGPCQLSSVNTKCEDTAENGRDLARQQNDAVRQSLLSWQHDVTMS